MFNCRMIFVTSILLVVVNAGCVSVPPSSPPTVWNKLGVPQVWNTATSHMINRNGGRPNRELKPPLTRLADPANLESDIPAIKEAAKVKMAEDQKKQKIKAVRYLAETVGCGCYDDSGEISDALIASLDDCTEEVRYATVKALLERARGNKMSGTCSKCTGGCCTEDMMNKLSEIGYEMKDNGCCVEPSVRVRETARAVLALCCPKTCQQPYYESYDAVPVEDPIGAPMPVPAETPPVEMNLEGPEEEAGSPTLPTTDGDSQAILPPQISPVAFSVTQNNTREAVAYGKVELVSIAENGAGVKLNNTETTLPVGTRCLLKRRNQRGRIDTLGMVSVSDSEPGAVIVQPAGALSINRIAIGDLLILAK